MSRSISVKDVQEAIAIINAWAVSGEYQADWAQPMIKGIADSLDQILALREYPIKLPHPKETHERK